MLKKKALALAVITSLTMGLPVLAQSVSLTDLQAVQQANLVIKQPGQSIDKSHWAYKSLKYLSNKYGLMLGDEKSQFAGDRPLTRDEAAVILVNLVGKIEKDKSKLSDVDKEKINTMKNEFSSELDALTGRVATLEGSVSKLEKSDKRSVKYGFADTTQISGAIQVKYTGNIHGQGEEAQPQNFSAPIVDMTFKGKIREHLDYCINTFPSRGSGSILGDVWLATDIVPHTKLYVGQTRKPLGLEGMQSPYTNDTIEKAQLARNFSDVRDLGITAKGKWSAVEYALGTYNGEGMNAIETNSGLELASMATVDLLHWTPDLGTLKVGGVYDYNNTSYKNRIYGAIGQYISPNEKFKLQSEYAMKNGYGLGNIKADGFYVKSAYSLTDKLELVGSFDRFNPNQAINDNELYEYTLGANYYFFNHNLKLMSDLVYVQNRAGDDSHRLLVMTQYRF